MCWMTCFTIFGNNGIISALSASDKEDVMHIMVDIETMGTGSTAAIVSIGAVAFSLEDAAVRSDNTFYVNVDLQSCIDCGLSVDGDTVMWWLGRDESARKSLIDNPLELPQALDLFTTYIQTMDKPCVWGNGATFDNVILHNAYKACGKPQPWHYREDRDLRTYVALCESVGLQWEWPDRDDIRHNALDDAMSQATAMCMLYGRLQMLKMSLGKL